MRKCISPSSTANAVGQNTIKISLADWPIVVHFVIHSFLCHIWTYYCRVLSSGTIGSLSVLLMVHYHIHCGLCSVRRPYMHLLNFIVYYNNIAK